MPCNDNAGNKSNSSLYIEPTIRVIAGFLLTVVGVVLYQALKDHHHFDTAIYALGFLFFISLNLFQSGFTGFCMMEKILKLFGLRSELDEIRNLNNEVTRSEAIQRNHIETLNLMNEAVLELTPDGKILSASDGWVRLRSCNNESSCESIGTSIFSYVENDDQQLLRETFSNAVHSDIKVHHLEFRLNCGNERNSWVSAKFMLEQVGDEEIKLRAVLRDITDSQEQSLLIKHNALHDSLTGLPNRVLLEERMEQALEDAKKNRTLMGVLFIDLDNFKQVNDIYGHKTGDRLLVSVSKIMQQRVRHTDTLARWGGDEFVVVFPDLKATDDLRDVAEYLMKNLETELVSEGFDTTVTLSIGGALYPNDGDTTESLLAQADKALYHAKDQGRNNVQIYTEMRQSDSGFYGFDISHRFGLALKDENIDVHYQVIVSSDDHKPVGLEALARWHDPKYGWVNPDVFISMAENLGLTHDLCKQVISKSLSDFAGIAKSSPQLMLALNISNRQLMQKDFCQWLIDLADNYGIRHSQIKLEITETLAQSSSTKIAEVLHLLRDSGFSLSLDDFGTGYSSLSTLHKLPVDEIKIDMSFVKRFTDKEGRVMLETIAAMGHSLGLGMVAEGVENFECMQMMRKLGIQRMQGHYFSKPLSWEETKEMFPSVEKEKPKGRPALKVVN